MCSTRRSPHHRRRGAVVVFGGLHVLSCPDECAPHCDAMAVGEGVQLWPQILRDVEADTLKKVYRGSYVKPYADDPPPARSRPSDLPIST